MERLQILEVLTKKCEGII